MKKGKHGKMNCDFSEFYDQESDVYYVTFKTGEPSYCKEVDDVLLLEMGMFTNMPTGFRILNFSKTKIAKINIVLKVRKIIEQSARLLASVQSREKQVEDALQSVLA